MPYSVYKITNTVNSKLYIGVTHTALSHRWLTHLCAARRCSARKNAYSPLYQDMMHHGVDKFSIDLIEVCPNKTVQLAREGHWIRELHTLHPNGYNLKGARMTDEQAAIVRFNAYGWRLEQYSQAFSISIPMLRLAKTDYAWNPYRHITRNHLPSGR